ncbi:glycosyl hydrolase family 95 catalytic domain-containing protein [Streptomyces atratus]|uniref:glycosyl hydrolase family 95 catalytic domain-containing protein n=1 Tax=Streptomyces atratus TaxID=1893 RepID=UPI00224EE128|nr:hypothetical protein [Streptomyces atratus]MCX5345706.1 hypothetical protein [Streptomyces atratus]
MNYWLTEVTNLAEVTAPYDRYIEAMRTPGRKTAKEMFKTAGAGCAPGAASPSTSNGPRGRLAVW